MRDQGKDPALQEWAERGLPKLRLISQAAEVPRPRDGDVAYADGTNWNPSAQGAGIYWYGLGSWYRLATGAGITLVDGDKGDVVVSGTGLVWTIDSNAVTFAKMQDIATDKLLGRDSAGSGDIEEIGVGNGLEFTGGGGLQIAADGVTFDQIQNVATNKLIGRVTTGSGSVEEVAISDFDAATAVALTDEVLVDQSGTQVAATIEQVRDAVFGDDWTDLVVPAVAINPAGSPAAPTLNSSTGCLEFSASADNVVILTWQMPHGWAGHYDSDKAVVVPHLHVRHLTSTSAPNNVSRWKIEYDVADPFGNFTNAYASWTDGGTVSVDNPADTTLCSLVDLGDLDLAGYGASAILHVKISRLASSDAADTDTSVIALYSADLHYQVRTAGSENEIPT